MCIPTKTSGAPAVPPAEYFRATQAVQRHPPLGRNREERLQQRRLEDPSLTSTSTSTSEADNDDGDYDNEDNAKFEDATERALQTTAYCTCQEFHSARALVRERETATAKDMVIIFRVLVALAVVILATKLISDMVFSTGASAFEVDVHDHAQFKCNVKRQLPPIEQGDTVIDSIFQIPINTLSAVGTLIKNVRPLVRRTRERFQQYYGTAPRQHRSVQQNNYRTVQQNNYRTVQQNNYSDGPEYYPIGQYSPQVQQNPGKYRTVYYMTAPTKPTIRATEFGKEPFKFE